MKKKSSRKSSLSISVGWRQTSCFNMGRRGVSGSGKPAWGTISVAGCESRVWLGYFKGCINYQRCQFLRVLIVCMGNMSAQRKRRPQRRWPHWSLHHRVSVLISQVAWFNGGWDPFSLTAHTSLTWLGAELDYDWLDWLLAFGRLGCPGVPLARNGWEQRITGGDWEKEGEPFQSLSIPAS